MVEIRHSKEFQRKIFSVMLHDSEFLEQVSEYMGPEHFSEGVERIIADIVFQFIKTPPTGLTFAILMQEITKRIVSGRIQKEEAKVIQDILRDEIRPYPIEIEYVKTEIQDFVNSRTMELALVESMDLLKKKSYREIFDSVSGAFQKSSSSGSSSVDISKDDLGVTMDSWIDRLLDLDDLGSSTGIPSPWPKLNDLMFHGGVGRKEIINFCGPPGRGKSVALMNYAVWAWLKGFNVLYYTLEVSKEIYTQRIQSCVTGLTMNSLKDNVTLLSKRWNTVRFEYPSMGKFILQEYPMRSLRPSNIRHDLKVLQDKGVKIDFLVPDYADIMSSDKKFGLSERRFEHGDINEELRAIGQEWNIAVATASQGNKRSLSKKDVDIEDMAEDFSKAMTADYVIGLSQTKEEIKERFSDGAGTGDMRLFVGKNRNGTKMVGVPVSTDFFRCRLSALDWLDFDQQIFGVTTYRR